VRLNGKEVNGYKVLTGVLATILAGVIVFALTLMFDKSDQALTTSLQAKEIAINNRQDIAVIYEKLVTIEKKIDEMKEYLDRIGR